MNLENKIKVGIRGISGLLGMRLALAIQKQPDMALTAGIARNDESLKRIVDGSHNFWPQPVYLDEPHRAVRELSIQYPNFHFEPADQLDFSKTCDVVVDTASPGSRQKWDEKYRHFGKPVIIQSGEYPAGRLIAPPLIEEAQDQGNTYRQGDCILSALAPLLAAIEPVSRAIRVHVLMQYGQKLNDYPTSQRTNATYLRDDLAAQIKEELVRLFRKKEIIMEGILQVPGLDYYTATIHFDTEVPVNGKDIEHLLSEQPRLMVAPPEIISTYEIDHLLREESRLLGLDIPPVVIYKPDLNFTEPRKKDIRIRATIYSRLIAVLPNIDSIRMLVKGTNPIEAMRLTDLYAGFEKRQ